MRRLILKYAFDATIVCVVLTFVAIVLLTIYQVHRAQNMMLHLLNGSSDVEISRFTIEGQQRRIECDDPEICRYLSSSMRKSILDYSASGQSYHGTFTLDGHNVWIECTYLSSGLGLSIPADDPIEIGIPTRSIFFREGVPAKLKQMWEFLNAPHKDISGKVMHIPNEGEPYFMFDQSIWDPN